MDSMTSISTNPSRKRSRDETAILSEDGSYFPDFVARPPTIAEEPIYGEGMMLLDPQGGRPLSAESQTGTWFEEKQEEEARNKPHPQLPGFRPRLPTSRKSIRLSQSDVPSAACEQAPASPPKALQIEVDEATIALGIGWTRLANEDHDIQAAARGWSRYLDNHYAHHIHGAEILLKSKGLNAYLVRCEEGFYLFAENLLEGRLVGRSWETTLVNLRAQPPKFEGETTLIPDTAQQPEQLICTQKMENWADYNRLNSQPGSVLANGDMDVD